jgi:4-alpha-glucanotransferase
VPAPLADPLYEPLLRTASGRQWERLSPHRRAGVAAPLFSLHSKTSIGAGEFKDLKGLGDWCRNTGLSIIQLLPMNDAGFDFRPYDAQSSFALEPMYLSLEDLVETKLKLFRKPIESLRRRFPPGGGRINTQIKTAKLELLWEIFKNNPAMKSARFARHARDNAYWLDDYALFKTLKEKYQGVGWWDWEPELKERREAALWEFRQSRLERIRFHQWVQWQAWEQLTAVKQNLARKNVLLMGDLPFLVSRDSADVWSHQDHFKLSLSAGAPPDLLFSKGQRWGMPPFDWEAIARRGHKYLTEKLKYAENFYDLFRLDHAVGLFRVWTVPFSEPPGTGGLPGAFDPPEEAVWEGHGRSLLSLMLERSFLLPCAEDLGTVPDCAYKVLAELGIPGMEVQRWVRNWKGDEDFKSPGTYRAWAVATLSTHDTPSLAGWWQSEATADEKKRYWKYVGLSGDAEDAPSPKLVRKALESINKTASIFSVQLLQEWLSLDGSLFSDLGNFRINFPGTTSDRNWSAVMPVSLEKINTLEINETIRHLNEQTGRIP